MQLGAFSVSLAVKNIQASRQFYETLGFTVLGGDESQHWLILKNGNALIGLFQGMFEKNILTFNPGWNESGQSQDPFDDVRVIQEHLKQAGISLTGETAAEAQGPGYITLQDPDGNDILIDQHR